MLFGKMKEPVLEENTAQSPVQRFPQTSSKYSISVGETLTDNSELGSP